MTQAHSTLTRDWTGTIISSYAMVRRLFVLAVLTIAFSYALWAQAPAIDAILEKAGDYNFR